MIASPISVPPIELIGMLLIEFIKESLSCVRSCSIKEFPEKEITPMFVPIGAEFTKSFAALFATSNRFGKKSVASMLEEESIATT
jgi:hypothetical protein